MAKSIKLKVFYTDKSRYSYYDKGFEQKIKWDIPLLDGYDYEFVNIYNIISRIEIFSPTQLLVYGWAHIGHLRLLLYFKGKLPVNFRGDSTLLNNRTGIKLFFKRLFLTWIYSHVDRAFYVGTNNRAYFRSYGLQIPQLKFAGHSVDNSRFSKPVDLNTLRSKLNINETAILILYAGKFDYNKNPDLLLQAFLELNLKDTHLLFAGSGNLEKALKSKSESHGKIHFLPFQNQSSMPALYQACDLFCLPTRNDSWGLCINEAMAAGKAILTSDKAGAAADLVSEKNGDVFISGNLRDLKEKLQKLVSDRSRLFTLGEHSAKIIERWSIEMQIINITTCL